MNLIDHEARIDAAERRMRDAPTRPQREQACRDFIAAIDARNAERTPDQVAELERARGLRS